MPPSGTVRRRIAPAPLVAKDGLLGTGVYKRLPGCSQARTRV